MKNTTKSIIYIAFVVLLGVILISYDVVPRFTAMRIVTVFGILGIFFKIVNFNND